VATGAGAVSVIVDASKIVLTCVVEGTMVVIVVIELITVVCVVEAISCFVETGDGPKKQLQAWEATDFARDRKAVGALPAHFSGAPRLVIGRNDLGKIMCQLGI